MALQYETTKEHTITVTGYEGTIRHLVIPDQVDGCPVKTIGKNAFPAREDLESVSIPKTVETLGRYAFYNCKKLKSISLYDSVEDYYDGVIKQCHCLEEVKLTQLRGDYSVSHRAMWAAADVSGICIQFCGRCGGSGSASQD